jgi:hypothetical protein
VIFSRSVLFLLIVHLVVHHLNCFRIHCVSLLSVSNPPLFVSVPRTSGV